LQRIGATDAPPTERLPALVVDRLAAPQSIYRACGSKFTRSRFGSKDRQIAKADQEACRADASGHVGVRLREKR